MDFNCSDIFDEPNEMRNVLEIRHYQEGRVEFEFEGDKVFHLQQDEFCVKRYAEYAGSVLIPI